MSDYTIEGGIRRVFLPSLYKYMPDAVLAQAAAVQNTWYTALDTTTRGVLYGATVTMSTLAEDIATQWTIDGVTLSGSQAGAVAGTPYYFGKGGGLATLTSQTTATGAGLSGNPIFFQSLKVEFRKTSANGANTLTGRVVYGVLV